MDNIIHITMEEFNLLEAALSDIRLYANIEHSILEVQYYKYIIYFSKVIDQNNRITKEN